MPRDQRYLALNRNLSEKNLLMLLMPAYSTAMQRGTVRRWYKDEGEEVRRGDLIAAVETDAATFDIESADDCELSNIRAVPGISIVVGEMIAITKMRSPISAYSARAFLRWQYRSKPDALVTPNYFYFGRPYFGSVIADANERGRVDPYSLACLSDEDIGSRRTTLLNAAPHPIENGIFGWPEMQAPNDVLTDDFIATHGARQPVASR